MSDTSDGTDPTGSSSRQLSDEQLNAYVLARLESLGVDLDDLPGDDPDAPVDRRRILRSARRFLRRTPPAIADFELSIDEAPPTLYPADPRGRTGGEPE